MIRTLGRLLIAGALAYFAAAPAARAEFDIRIQSSATGTININVADPINVSGRTDTIQVNTSALNAALAGAGFTFSSLSANIIPVAGSDILNVSGTVVSSGFTGPITISGSALNYTFASGAATLVSQGTQNYTGGFGGATFNSFFSTSNVEFTTTGPTVTNPSPLVFAGNVAPPQALSNTVGVSVVGAFSLTNTTTLTLTTTGAQDAFTGITTVRAVPEPGSMALVLLGGTALVARLRRRKVEA